MDGPSPATRFALLILTYNSLQEAKGVIALEAGAWRSLPPGPISPIIRTGPRRPFDGGRNRGTCRDLGRTRNRNQDRDASRPGTGRPPHAPGVRTPLRRDARTQE